MPCGWEGNRRSGVQHPVFTGRMPFLLPNQQCQITKGKKDERPIPIKYHVRCLSLHVLVTWFSATSLRENPEPTIKKLIPKHSSQEPEAMARRARKVPQIKQSEVASSRTAIPSRWQRRQSDKSASFSSSSDEEVIPDSGLHYFSQTALT